MFDGFYREPPSYDNIRRAVCELKERFPFLKTFPIGKSVLGRSIYALGIGDVYRGTLFVGGVHGMEWLTTLLLFRFCEDILSAMTTGEPLESNVVCAIEDCGYTSVWDECRANMKDVYGLPTFPFLSAARSATMLRAGYDMKKASCIEQVSRSVTPTLFIHGDKDDFVPFWMQERVYRAAACDKEKLVIPGAPHAEASTVDPEKYWSTVDKFIKKYL